MQTKLIDN